MARGSIEKRKTSTGETRYRARIAGESQTFRTKRAAERWLNERADEIDAGSYQRPSTEPFASYLDHWLDTHDMAPASRRAYEGVIRRWIVPKLGNVPLSQLTGRHVQDLYNQARGSSSINQIQAVISGALRQAVREGLIPRNVADGLTIVKPEREDHEPPVWTPAQLRAFLNGVSGHWLAPLFHVAAYTGLRVGELVALRWDDITLDMGMLFVRQSKSAAGRRRVALDPDTVTVLRAHREDQARRREILGPDWQNHGVVFDCGDGRPVSPRTIEAVMARTVQRLGLTPVLTPHGLRHTFASSLASQGVPLTVIQQLLGHASYNTTAAFYVHHGPADDRAAVAAFAALLRDAGDVARHPESVRPHSVPTAESAS
ncbi:tyrosine-type recombinase/integrase [Nitrolancea hollandica]|uniref:Putative Integrase family protein n=1 Tax=Nitrolancea hollandica Lb TaxID=1129897 RepID=I4EFZ1_9BACT|nr:site-specific integrase [Nitrolancea hollandica]CCF83603.1 putative Integrase family protein [Nitrolancea hollandica Lb]